MVKGRKLGNDALDMPHFAPKQTRNSFRLAGNFLLKQRGHGYSYPFYGCTDGTGPSRSHLKFYNNPVEWSRCLDKFGGKRYSIVHRLVWIYGRQVSNSVDLKSSDSKAGKEEAGEKRFVLWTQEKYFRDLSSKF